jgi:hypothetical protein
MGRELGQGLLPIRRRLDRGAILVQQPGQAMMTRFTQDTCRVRKSVQDGAGSVCRNRATIVSRGGKAAVHFIWKSVHDWHLAPPTVGQRKVRRRP